MDVVAEDSSDPVAQDALAVLMRRYATITNVSNFSLTITNVKLLFDEDNNYL